MKPSIGKYLNRERKGTAQDSSWGADDNQHGLQESLT